MTRARVVNAVSRFLLLISSFIAESGGRIKSYVSYCGGLPAPESAENPLKYKFSWAPRAVIGNTTGAARWLQEGLVVDVPAGGSLMDRAMDMDFLTGFNLEGVPNRDSTIYRELYGLHSAETVLRGTLRYKGFCDVMKGLILLGLIDPNPHPSLHSGGPDLTWKQLVCRLLGQQESILMTNLRNFVLERVQSESRLHAISRLGLLSDEETIEKMNTPLDTVAAYLQVI
jgi:alpha-aminoadipic semialdehyde synthase